MSASSVPVYVSTSPPAAPVAKGSLWFNPIDSKMKIWLLQPGGGVWTEVFNTPGDIPFVFVSASPPENPINGTLWYLPNGKVLKIWINDGMQQGWETLLDNCNPATGSSVAIVSDSPPESPAQGTLWFKPSNSTLSVWSSPNWVVVSGPAQSDKPSCYISSSPPPNPVQGDLWWHPNLKEFRVWKEDPTGDIWDLVTDNTPPPQTPPVYTSVVEPVNPKQRYLWYNPQNKETKMWDGFNWILISKVIPGLTDSDTQGKVNNSLLYYDSTAGKFKANSTVTTSTLTDGGNF